MANGKWVSANGNQTTDANTVNPWTCYIFGSGVDFVNNPFSSTYNKILLTYLAGYGFKIQVCYTDAPGVKFRIHNGSYNNWTQWYTVTITT